MARMDYGKAARVALWKASAHNVWSGQVPQANRPASEKQVKYLQHLLKQAGRRQLRAVEVEALTAFSASRLIDELTTKSQ